MSDTNQTSKGGSAERKLTLNHSQTNETLFVETEEENDEVVLSSGSDGSSLTLLEEYSMKNASKSRLSAVLALLCAAISISFALMIFKTL